MLSKNNKLKTSLKGFTVIELLVIVAVMSFMGASMLANQRQGERRKSITGAAQEAVTVLRRAQTAALAGETYQGCPTAAFLVSFNTSETGNGLYRICAVLPSEINNPPSFLGCANNRIVEEIQLPRNVIVGRIAIRNSTGCSFTKPDASSIIFSAPYGDIRIIASDGEDFSHCNVAVSFVNRTSSYFGTSDVWIYSQSGKFDIQTF